MSKLDDPCVIIMALISIMLPYYYLADKNLIWPGHSLLVNVYVLMRM